MKTSVAVVILSIGILLTTHGAHSEKSDGILASIQRSWGSYIHRAQKQVYANFVAILMPILERSKRFVDPAGWESIDVLISNLPIFTNAFYSNDKATIHQMLKEYQKSMDVMAPHITHAQFRTTATERIDAFSSLVDCIHQGKCGLQAFIHYLFSSISSMKELHKLLSD